MPVVLFVIVGDDFVVQLSDVEIEVAKELLLMMQNNQYSITYGELCERLTKRTKFQLNPHTELPKKLGKIGKLCMELNLPMINAMVVNSHSKQPGDGFIHLLNQLGENVKNKDSRELFAEEKKRIREYSNWQYLADYLKIDVVMPARGEIIYTHDITEKESFEGAKTRVTVNRYERDAFERKRCIDYYSKDGRICCQICGFDFGKFYGENYKNLIEVHHIKPISEIGKSYKIDGTKDLIPLCPNCHMVIHSKNAETINELKARLSEKRA